MRKYGRGKEGGEGKRREEERQWVEDERVGGIR
jgi:hypothetical protein